MSVEADPVKTISKTFKYSFPTCTNEELLFKLEVPVEIPHDGSTRELVQRVINGFRIPDMFHIPVYLEDDLNEKLAEFVYEETKHFHNNRDENLINQLKNSELNVEGIVKNWEKLFKDNVMEFAEQKGTSDDEVFAAAYHKLVHSPALETILQVENSYAKTFSEVRKNRDEDIKQLTLKQTEEMEEKVRQLNVTTTEEEINELATCQFEEQALVAGRWGSQLDALWQTQRTQFRAWLVHTLTEYQAQAALATPSNSPLATFSSPLGGMDPLPPSSSHAAPAPAAPSVHPPRQRLEESFTIHLGSQLKQTHNIRIVATDPVDLAPCDVESGRRLQTALSLYSSELSGAVLATEAPPARPAPPTTALLEAASATTDHHLPSVDIQLRQIIEKIKEPVSRREQERAAGAGAGAGGGHSRGLRAGDVFVTSHGNLPDAHVVFHLMVGDSRHRTGEITSRHPAILGLRNILKAASCNDVTSIVLPLLLRHEITEEMTVSWCVRRAELVLKCVKGFMLETAGVGGAELRTVTLALPPSTPHHVFTSLAALLPQVFRISNPVKITRVQDQLNIL